MYASGMFIICLMASISMHLCLILPWQSMNFISKSEIPFKKIEMTYFNENKILRTETVDIKPQNTHKPVISSEIKSGSKMPDGLNSFEPVFAKKEEQKPPEDKNIKKEENPKNTSERTEETRDKVEIIDIGTQKGIVYEKYYFDVREKIRSIIERNKKGILNESEVRARFVLDKNGALKDLCLYKSSGVDAGSLEKLAAKSIKEAAPFPPFTNKIKEGELQFNLPIRVINE